MSVMSPLPQPQKSSNVPYLVAVVVMILIATVGVLVILMLRPDNDNTQLIATIVGMIVPTTAAILALMKSQETHLTVNSDLAQWKHDFAALMRAQGVKEGTEVEQARVAEQKALAAAVAASTAERRGKIETHPAPAVSPEPIVAKTVNVVAEGEVHVVQDASKPREGTQ